MKTVPQKDYGNQCLLVEPRLGQKFASCPAAPWFMLKTERFRKGLEISSHVR